MYFFTFLLDDYSDDDNNQPGRVKLREQPLSIQGLTLHVQVNHTKMTWYECVQNTTSFR